MQGLLPNFDLPAQVQAEKQRATEVRVTHQFAPMEAKLGALENRLAAIEQNTSTTASRKDVVPTADGYMTVDPVTRSTHRVRLLGPTAS